MVTVHVGAAPAPAQIPDHDPNADPAAGVAVSVTVVPGRKTPLQEVPALPQLMPPVLLVIVPLPATLTERTWPVAKLAVTACAWLIVTVQFPLPEHAPDQPAKVEPAAGVADNVTPAPLLKLALHVVPQEMP